MPIKYFMIIFILYLSCSSERSLESEFQQLQSSMTTIAAFKERCEVIIKDSREHKDKPEAVFYLGRLNELFDHYEEAVDYYRYLLIAFPEHALCSEGLYRIGYIHENHIGNRTKAKTAYDQLIAFYPESPFVEKAILSYAQLSSEQKQWQQAMDYFKQYLANYPESRINDDINYRLADIMQSGIKDTVQAEILYRQFLIDYPQSSWRVYAEKKIERMQNSEVRSQKSESKNSEMSQ